MIIQVVTILQHIQTRTLARPWLVVWVTEIASPWLGNGAMTRQTTAGFSFQPSPTKPFDPAPFIAADKATRANRPKARIYGAPAPTIGPIARFLAALGRFTRRTRPPKGTIIMTTELPVSLKIALAGARADLDAAYERKTAAEARVAKIRTTIAAATGAAATLAEALVESDGAALLAPTPRLSDLASRAALAEQAAAVARAALPAAQAEIDAAQADIEAAELHQRDLVGTGLAHVRDDLLDR